MRVLFCKQLEMVLGISLTGPVGLLTKHVCCHRPELRILGLFGVLGLREQDGSGQAAQVPIALHLKFFLNTKNQTTTGDWADTNT